MALRIEAPLLVPAQCDAIHLTARRVSDAATVFERTDDLAAKGTAFPLTLSLTTSDRANLGEDAVSLEVEALLSGARAAPWAFARQALPLRSGEVAAVTVKLCDCGM